MLEFASHYLALVLKMEMHSLPGDSKHQIVYWGFGILSSFSFSGDRVGKQDLVVVVVLFVNFVFGGFMFASKFQFFSYNSSLLLVSPWNVNYTQSFIFQLEEKEKKKSIPLFFPFSCY